MVEQISQSHPEGKSERTKVIGGVAVLTTLRNELSTSPDLSSVEVGSNSKRGLSAVNTDVHPSPSSGVLKDMRGDGSEQTSTFIDNLESELVALYIDAAWERDEESDNMYAKGLEAAADRIKKIIEKHSLSQPSVSKSRKADAVEGNDRVGGAGELFSKSQSESKTIKHAPCKGNQAHSIGCCPNCGCECHINGGF